MNIEVTTYWNENSPSYSIGININIEIAHIVKIKYPVAEAYGGPATYSPKLVNKFTFSR